ncbi:AAA family ATPase [Acidobacteriota bacterium]
MKRGGNEFWRKAGRILNSGQSRTIVLTGNIHDLFPLSEKGNEDDYVPIIDFLTSKWDLEDWILVVYELNGPIRFFKDSDKEIVRHAWLQWRTGLDSDSLAMKRMLAPSKMRSDLDSIARAFESKLTDAIGKPTLALEILRQMCLCSRSTLHGGPNLIVLIEGADMLVPEGEITRLCDADRHRVSICRDWFSDPGFINGGDAVILIAESRSLLNQRIAQLPQVLEVQVPSPDMQDRKRFISSFNQSQPESKKIRLWGSQADLARLSAGLSIHALMQLLKGACHENKRLTIEDVVNKVEEFIKSQLGEDMVEFKKPDHDLRDVIGFTELKRFLKDELIPRFRSMGPDALPGAAVCGPIGSGKTFIFEAVANELDIVVLVLKNIRSQWFGQTDVILERLRRVLDALSKVLIFLDEADTQMGGVGPDTHPTERRLTGKIQAMMSDTKLRGRVHWLLMTARIHLLSPDIRRPGRVGDLIIPVLDPRDEDRVDFLKWMVKPVLKGALTKKDLALLEENTKGYSSASFASLRSELQAKAGGGKLTLDEIVETVHDHIPPAIGKTRKYQTLQALINCTRRSLLPDPAISDEDRQAWLEEIRKLELEIGDS